MTAPNRLRPLLIAAALACLPCASALAETIRVPHDQPSIQQAVDAAENGDEILIWPGTYVEDVVVNQLDRLTLRGKGKVVLRRPSTGSIGRVLSIEKSEFVVVEGLSFDADAQATGLRVISCQAVEVRGCRFDGLSVAIQVDDCDGAVLEGNRISDVFTGLDLRDSEQLSATGNTIHAAAAYGMILSGVDTSVVVGNSLRDLGNYGLLVSGVSHHVTVADNDVRDAVLALAVRGNNNSVLDNRVTGAVIGIRLGSGLPADFTLLARGNRISKVETVALHCWATESLIVANTIKGAGTLGVSVETSKVLIADNLITGCGDQGIDVDGSQCSIMGNRVRKTGAAGIQVSNSSNAVFANELKGTADS